jgi:hypothetical protein
MIHEYVTNIENNCTTEILKLFLFYFARLPAFQVIDLNKGYVYVSDFCTSRFSAV